MRFLLLLSLLILVGMFVIGSLNPEEYYHWAVKAFVLGYLWFGIFVVWLVWTVISRFIRITDKVEKRLDKDSD